MAIQDKDIQSTDLDSVFHQASTFVDRKKLCKLLVISENSSDIFMLKKVFSKGEGYIIHEAATLSIALKVMNYLSLDLILVDDMLSNLDGYEVVEKLNMMDITKEIPKIIMLTEDFKTDKKESMLQANIDFVKKPFDSVLVKLRVNSMIKHREKKEDRKNYFQELANQKFDESKSLMNVYQEIFETSKSMMCIYDHQRKMIVESNAVFEKFFLNLKSFNRIISNPRLVRKFVAFKEEVNYINYYDPQEWMQTLVDGADFSYLVKLQRDYKEYSFTIFVKKIELENQELYSIKLSNIHDFLVQKNVKQDDSKLQLKEKNFEAFKDDFLILRDTIWNYDIQNSEIERLLYQLSTKLSIVCDDSSIIKDAKKKKEINLYFVLIHLIKEKFLNKNIYVNGKEVTKISQENDENINAILSAEALSDLIFGLLSNYYGSYFSPSINHKRLDITLSEKNDDITIMIRLNELDKNMSRESLVDKIFNKSVDVSHDDIADMLPKNAKNALNLLNANIKKREENTQSIFIITLPSKM